MKNLLYLKIVYDTYNVNYSRIYPVPLIAFIYDLSSKRYYSFNFSHQDKFIDGNFVDFLELIRNGNILVNNKKQILYYLDVYLSTHNIRLYDINLDIFLREGTTLDSHVTFSLPSIGKVDDNQVIPFSLHEKRFESEIVNLDFIEIEHLSSYEYKFFNETVTESLFSVEKNGLCVDPKVFEKFFYEPDGEIVYSEYNLYNSTGRPSNHYKNVNFVALNKENGCRESFISRYENGNILMIDYEAFHPNIAAQLIDYSVENDENIYIHLARGYYNKDVITDEDIKKSKKFTMFNLYGDINEYSLKIPFFKKLEELKHRYWFEFTEQGYVETPIYKRKINTHHIKSPNKNKLFSYIMQATETEHAISNLQECIRYSFNKNITPILYVYDSIVFDIGEDIGEDHINILTSIFENKKFKVKSYIGKNYNDLRIITS